jgi:protein O-GlcNAc transferase
LAVYPDHADCLHLLGTVALQSGRLDLAVAIITRAITANGAIAQYHCTLGNAFGARGQLDEAIACFDRAISLRP